MASTEEVIEICEAYELGLVAGKMNLSTEYNNFKDKSSPYYAWLLGHNSGLQQEMFELAEVRPN